MSKTEPEISPPIAL